ncbi:MAG: enoyl-CoA hydratase, partial [Pseudomonas sp.]|nr:enoyl-CoA hydratase [Pseudomonas sp.]
QRAADIALATHALPAGAPVHAAARAAALRIAELPPGSISLSKQLLKHGVAQVADEVMDREGEHFARLLKGPEAREALSAFIEKRKPVFA